MIIRHILQMIITVISVIFSVSYKKSHLHAFPYILLFYLKPIINLLLLFLFSRIFIC